MPVMGMTSRLRFWTAVAVAVLLAGTKPGTAMPRAEEEVAAVPPPATSEPAFHLAFDLDDPRPGNFDLFGSGYLVGWDAGMDSLEWRYRTAASPGPPGVGSRPLVLGLTLREEPGPEGSRRLVIAPLTREWDDLTPWEKFGVTLSYAGAAAAMVHFAKALADKASH